MAEEEEEKELVLGIGAWCLRCRHRGWLCSQVCVYDFLSIHPCLYLSIYLFLYISSIYLSIYLHGISIYLSIYLSIYMQLISVCVRARACASACMSAIAAAASAVATYSRLLGCWLSSVFVCCSCCVCLRGSNVLMVYVCICAMPVLSTRRGQESVLLQHRNKYWHVRATLQTAPHRRYTHTLSLSLTHT